MRIHAAVSGTALVVALLALGSSWRSPSDVVEATVFRVVGANGRTAAELRRNEGGGAELLMFDGHGVPRLALGLEQAADEDALCSTFLRFMHQRGDSMLSIEASSGDATPPWTTLALGQGGGPQLAMSCEEGTHTDTVALRLYDRTGRESAKLSANDNGGASGLVVRSFPHPDEQHSNGARQVSMVAMPPESLTGGCAIRIGGAEGAGMKLVVGDTARIEVVGESGETWQIER